MADQEISKKDLLSVREMEILSKVWVNMKTTPEIDMAQVAQDCGMTNVGSASNAWAKIKKKLTAAAGGPNAAAPTPRKRKAPATPKSKSKLAGMGEDDDEPVEETPTKKRKTPAKASRKTPTKKSAVKSEDNIKVEDEDAGDEDEKKDLTIEAKVEEDVEPDEGV